MISVGGQTVNNKTRAQTRENNQIPGSSLLSALIVTPRKQA